MEALITIVRHGQTTANKEHIIQGQSDYELNDHGRVQAEKAGKALADERFDAIYSSDLKRAFETASIIVNENKSFNSIENISKWKVLRERTFGVMESKPFSEYYEEAKRQNPDMTPRIAWLYTPKGGETMKDVRERAKLFHKMICDEIKKSSNLNQPKLLIVSHGGFIKDFVHYLVSDRQCKLPGESFKRLPGNTSISKFVMKIEQSNDKVHWKCMQLYDMSHIEDEETMAVA